MSSNSFPLFTNKAGDNQFGNYSTGMPGVVPAAPNYGDSGDMSVKQATSGGIYKQGDFSSVAPMSPNLTTDFFNFLKSNIGKGATPYNLSASLPSSGGATAPGQLSAPLNPVLQQLADFYSGKPTTLPGMDTLSETSKTGLPVDQTPAWQAMVEAQQRNIGQNEAGLREQFASLGSLKGSPFGQAEAQYRMQTAKDQNAALLAATAGAQENAAGRRLAAGGLLQAGGQQVASILQQLDQDSIDRLVKEFIRTRPEYSPYLNLLYGAATTFAPTVQTGKGGGVLGGIASLLKLAPEAVGAISRSRDPQAQYNQDGQNAENYYDQQNRATLESLYGPQDYRESVNTVLRPPPVPAGSSNPFDDEG